MWSHHVYEEIRHILLSSLHRTNTQRYTLGSFLYKYVHHFCHFHKHTFYITSIISFSWNIITFQFYTCVVPTFTQQSFLTTQGGLCPLQWTCTYWLAMILTFTIKPLSNRGSCTIFLDRRTVKLRLLSLILPLAPAYSLLNSPELTYNQY